MSFETTILLLTWAAIALLAFVVAGMVRRVHFLSLGVRPTRLDDGELGLEPGTVAPEFSRLRASGSEPTVLLFLDRTCGVCPGVLEETQAVLAESPTPISVAALFSGEASASAGEEIRVFAREDETFEKYRIPAVPYAVLVDPAGRVQTSQPVGSPGALRTFLGADAEPANLSGEAS